VIDLHCHLCFGVDDGPRSAEETVELARALADAGVEEVACTSHIRPNKGWMNDARGQDALHAQLDEVLDAAGVALKHHRGAEHYFDAEVLDEDFDDRLVPYGSGRWLLVEMPYEGAPIDALGPLYRLRRRGWKLLLAHVERYPWLADDEEMLDRLTGAGYLLQVNLGSLGGAYTRAHKKTAERLVKRGLISVAAGDCHRAKDVARCIEKGRKALEKIAGAERAQRMTETVPRAILDDASPEALWP
jgi:protein-tyrosine phosphatase